MVEALLAKGADVNATAGDGRTALIFAAQEGHTGVIEILLAHSPDLNAKDALGATALSEALANARPAIVELLKKAGAKR